MTTNLALTILFTTWMSCTTGYFAYDVNQYGTYLPSSPYYDGYNVVYYGSYSQQLLYQNYQPVYGHQFARKLMYVGDDKIDVQYYDYHQDTSFNDDNDDIEINTSDKVPTPSLHKNNAFSPHKSVIVLPLVLCIMYAFT